MKKYLRYISYVIRHKIFVFQAGWRMNRKVPLWQLIIHDWSKFLPSELVPYTNYFYGSKPLETQGLGWSYDPAKGSLAFNTAWLKHQHRNPHHWQHWVLRNDDGTTMALEMPVRYMKEMVADWMGAGRAIRGVWGTCPEWYELNKHKIVLHPATRNLVELWLKSAHTTIGVQNA